MDALYDFDEEKLASVRKAKPWTQDPKHFRRVRVTASATMKMLQHAVGGCEKGMESRGGKPVEVMGLLLGRPDVDDPRALLVLDVFPLPIDGAETKVLADDQEVMNLLRSITDC